MWSFSKDFITQSGNSFCFFYHTLFFRCLAVLISISLKYLVDCQFIVIIHVWAQSDRSQAIEHLIPVFVDSSFFGPVSAFQE